MPRSLSPERARALQQRSASVQRAKHARRRATNQLARANDLLDDLERHERDLESAVVALSDLTADQRRVVEALLAQTQDQSEAES